MIDPLGAIREELGRIATGAIHAVRRERESWVPAVDLVETAAEFEISFDLPGVEPEGIELAADGPSLTVRGERPAPAGGNLVVHERRSGAFFRRVELPSAIDPDHIEANCRDGVLRVRVPKAAEARGRTIPVQTC